MLNLLKKNILKQVLFRNLAKLQKLMVDFGLISKFEQICGTLKAGLLT